MCGAHLLCRKTVFIVCYNWFRYRLRLCLRLWMATELRVRRVCTNGNRMKILVTSSGSWHYYFSSRVCILCGASFTLCLLSAPYVYMATIWMSKLLLFLRFSFGVSCIFMVLHQMFLTVLLFIVWLLDEHFAENVLWAHVFPILCRPPLPRWLSIILAFTENKFSLHMDNIAIESKKK